MKIDGFWNLAFFAFVLIFALGMASLGAKKSSNLLGLTTTTPTPFRLPTNPPFPTVTPGGPTVTPNPNAPTNTPGPATSTPIPPTATTIPLPPTATPTSPPCPAQTTDTFNTASGLQQSADFGKLEDKRVDLNLGLRVLTNVNQPKTLINYTADATGADPGAPQFASILGRGPNITNVYWAEGELDHSWPVNVMGLTSSPGDRIIAAHSGHSPAGEAIVIYARGENVALRYYLMEGAIAPGGLNAGYTLYIQGVCINPGLITAYNNLANIRTSLPYVNRDQSIGVAKGYEVRVAIRDGLGSMMDPRSRADWWQGY